MTRLAKACLYRAGFWSLALPLFIGAFQSGADDSSLSKVDVQNKVKILVENFRLQTEDESLASLEEGAAAMVRTALIPYSNLFEVVRVREMWRGLDAIEPERTDWTAYRVFQWDNYKRLDVDYVVHGTIHERDGNIRVGMALSRFSDEKFVRYKFYPDVMDLKSIAASTSTAVLAEEATLESIYGKVTSLVNKLILELEKIGGFSIRDLGIGCVTIRNEEKYLTAELLRRYLSNFIAREVEKKLPVVRVQYATSLERCKSNDWFQEIESHVSKLDVIISAEVSVTQKSVRVYPALRLNTPGLERNEKDALLGELNYQKTDDSRGSWWIFELPEIETSEKTLDAALHVARVIVKQLVDVFGHRGTLNYSLLGTLARTGDKQINDVLEKARSLTSSGETAAAKVAWQQVLSENAKRRNPVVVVDAEAYLLLGLLHTDEEESLNLPATSVREEYYRKSLEYVPPIDSSAPNGSDHDLVRVIGELAMALEFDSRGDPSAAEQQIHEILARPTIRKLLTKTENGSRHNFLRKRLIDVVRKVAQRAWEINDYGNAEHLTELLIEGHTETADVLSLNAATKFYKKEYDKSHEMFKKVLSIDSSDRRAQVGVFMSLFEKARQAVTDRKFDVAYHAKTEMDELAYTKKFMSTSELSYFYAWLKTEEVKAIVAGKGTVEKVSVLLDEAILAIREGLSSEDLNNPRPESILVQKLNLSELLIFREKHAEARGLLSEVKETTSNNNKVILKEDILFLVDFYDQIASLIEDERRYFRNDPDLPRWLEERPIKIEWDLSLMETLLSHRAKEQLSESGVSRMREIIKSIKFGILFSGHLPSG